MLTVRPPHMLRTSLLVDGPAGLRKVVLELGTGALQEHVQSICFVGSKIHKDIPRLASSHWDFFEGRRDIEVGDSKKEGRYREGKSDNSESVERRHGASYFAGARHTEPC